MLRTLLQRRRARGPVIPAGDADPKPDPEKQRGEEIHRVPNVRHVRVDAVDKSVHELLGGGGDGVGQPHPLQQLDLGSLGRIAHVVRGDEVGLRHRDCNLDGCVGQVQHHRGLPEAAEAFPVGEGGVPELFELLFSDLLLHTIATACREIEPSPPHSAGAIAGSRREPASQEPRPHAVLLLLMLRFQHFVFLRLVWVAFWHCAALGGMAEAGGAGRECEVHDEWCDEAASEEARQHNPLEPIEGADVLAVRLQVSREASVQRTARTAFDELVAATRHCDVDARHAIPDVGRALEHASGL
mmetsp:Transcript_3827/g.9321  ORF Transcript_3827/g.9321 Transcript_3827/m.9321 type:complete len:299 (+) Transcript_3827:1107-2003(+)